MRIKHYEIVNLLTDTRITDRQVQFVGNRDGNAAFGRSVQFRQHDSGYACDLQKLSRLFEPVLTSDRVDDQQRFMWRAFDFAPATRFIFSNSAIKFDFVCSRPAVSTMSTSEPRAFAAFKESNKTAAGSVPCFC